MHPEILSISLFWFVTAYTPGPNNVVASYSGFNFGITKTMPHILGVTLGFTSLVLFLSIGLINIFKLFPIIQIIMRYIILKSKNVKLALKMFGNHQISIDIGMMSLLQCV